MLAAGLVVLATVAILTFQRGCVCAWVCTWVCWLTYAWAAGR